MSSPDFSPAVADASRPSLGFPLGTGLLLIVIFSLSGIFSCFYHWEKLRSLRRSYSHNNDLEAGSSKSKLLYSNMTQKQQSLPVLMPGDNIPKFIALPCPCEPLHQEKMVAEVKTPPKPPLQTKWQMTYSSIKLQTHSESGCSHDYSTTESQKILRGKRDGMRITGGVGPHSYNIRAFSSSRGVSSSSQHQH